MGSLKDTAKAVWSKMTQAYNAVPTIPGTDTIGGVQELAKISTDIVKEQYATDEPEPKDIKHLHKKLKASDKKFSNREHNEASITG